jgi:hypothetical protein
MLSNQKVIPHALLYVSILATCHANLILLLIVLIIFGEEYNV